jgi:hypothetical protein
MGEQSTFAVTPSVVKPSSVVAIALAVCFAVAAPILTLARFNT